MWRDYDVFKLKARDGEGVVPGWLHPKTSASESNPILMFPQARG